MSSVILSLFASVLVTWKYTSTAVAASCRLLYTGSAVFSGSTAARSSLRQFSASTGGATRDRNATEAAAARLNILPRLTYFAELDQKFECALSVTSSRELRSPLEVAVKPQRNYTAYLCIISP